MPTKRRKRPPLRINEPVPPWAARLLAGEQPDRESEDGLAFFGWLFLGDRVPGLPDPETPEGCRLWRGHAD
jgi:hypothetical protein